MVTQQQIAEYLKKVPPLSEALKKSFEALENGDLAGASKAAATDPAIIYYLKQIVNSAAFGFRNEVTDPSQIFSILGIARVKQLLYAFMVHSMAPKKWNFFKLSRDDFIQFQASMMNRWEKIVKAENADEFFLSASAIMSAGLVVADGIFGDHADDIALIRQVEDLDLDTILERVAKVRFDSIVVSVAKIWEVDPNVIDLVKLSFAKKDCSSEEIKCRLSKYLHLLLFYELSRPVMLEAGANSFIEFKPQYVSEVVSQFQDIVGVE
ncbi:HDOD domain-containing protein [Hydrogenimonas thermophila]|uniref:HDOD domain-containing protein n=1 Tax=Hydrogenimonas thermophila TaxID=223786 RepID=A0A1I5N2N3_9BACT|nr:HDOD domain-containing protein [Hydrogenimonas thermophila]WOE70298.1 HDOD domain-containing protein [Hydrogenimonas thermophila]WOE72815.1 HDOD domain-containing protein [Hydrogenimonas thermophila]SFP16023.1 HDOD domain-containing protein [Hydrogenimonas thermophila]